MKADVERWLAELKFPYSLPVGFIFLLGLVPEFRNLFYFRIKGNFANLLSIVCPRMKTLILDSKVIGEGLVIRHGIGSGISAESIGKNCTIYQQVSIGYYKGFPTIFDNVTIYPGAVIMGKVKIGNNAIIGANSSVFQDVPDNCTVYPARSMFMKWKHINPETRSQER